MTALLSLVVAALVGAGLYLVLSRSLLRVVLGLVLLGHGANALLFVAGGLTRGVPPLVSDAVKHAPDAAPPAGAADPLPQALVLTAIVIGFAVVAFAAVLVRRAYDALGDDDVDRAVSTDR